jgi:hypothetical protein
MKMQWEGKKGSINSNRRRLEKTITFDGGQTIKWNIRK